MNGRIAIWTLGGVGLITLGVTSAHAQLGGFLKALGDVLEEASTQSSDTTSPPKSLIGEWSSDTCIDSSGSDYFEGANLSITADSISGFEWGCDLSPKIRPGASTYVGKMTCYGDTDDTVKNLTLRILPNGKLEMVEGRVKSTLHSCRG